MEQLQHYIDYLTHIKKYSSNTTEAYHKDIEQFLAFTKSSFNVEKLEDISHFIIRSWIVSMMQEGVATARSINRKLSSLNGFFKFLIQNKLVKKNPMAKVVGPKTGKRLPDAISEKEMSQIVSKNIVHEDAFEMSRNILIINLLYQTGIRRSELLNIKNFDVNRERKEIRVVGKGKKERMIPISIMILEFIDHYIITRDNTVSLQDDFLIVSNKGKKMNPRTLYNIVNKYLSEATTSEKKSPHVLRHSFATHLLNNGADINSIKEILGHANLAATQVYTHNSIERLKLVYKKAHPKSN